VPVYLRLTLITPSGWMRFLQSDVDLPPLALESQLFGSSAGTRALGDFTPFLRASFATGRPVRPRSRR